MRILIPVDGSPFADAALGFVASRPTFNGDRPSVDLLNVQLPMPPRAGRAVDADFERSWHVAESRKVLQPAVDRLQAAGIDPAWHFRVGYPGLTIGDWAAEHDIDLIVMGSHGRTAVKNILLGSVTQTVLASCATPLLVLREPAAPKAVSLRVGIALDGSDCGIEAARFVMQHRAFIGPHPQVTLVHVHEPDDENPPSGEQSSRSGIDDLATGSRASCDAVAAPVLPLLRQAGIEATLAPLVGRPGVEIAHWATASGTDILVLGSHGRGALTSAMLGSVAWRVAAACKTPLLFARRLHLEAAK